MSDCDTLRWIAPLHLCGAWQMAIDEWLLEQALPRGTAAAPGSPCGPVLRFYTWSRPTLSLGFHQRRLEPHWLELHRRGELDLVRRPSGGQAVLHDGELTYALVWPLAPARRKEAYRQACTWLQEGFASLGRPLRFGERPPDPRNPSCFAASTAADLVESNGGKRIGSAQLWRRGVLLQHGSILLAPDPGLWRQVLAEDPPELAPLAWSHKALIERLREAARKHLPLAMAGWRDGDLAPWEWSAIATRLARYRVDGMKDAAAEVSPPGPQGSRSGG